jgi:hypothetical protein
MKNEDMTLATFRSEVLSRTSYAITDELIEEFWEEGDSVEDTLEWCEWKLDGELFGDF